MKKKVFVDKLKSFLKTLSPEAQDRILDDMKRLNNSILCEEHTIYNPSKKKPISRYGTPIKNWLINEISAESKMKIDDLINWKITKNKNLNYLEVRNGLKYILLSIQKFNNINNDNVFVDLLINEMNTNQDCLFKSTAPLKYKSKYPGNKINVGKRTSLSKNSKNVGYTKEHLIPTRVVFECLKNSVFENNIENDFDFIMKDNFQVLLNSDDDEKLNKAGLRSKMPPNWKFGEDPFERYKLAGIDLSTIIKIKEK